MNRWLQRWKRRLVRLLMGLLLTLGWQYVPGELADSLAEGDDAYPARSDTRHWEQCIWNKSYDNLRVLCPDGYMERQ